MRFKRSITGPFTPVRWKVMLGVLKPIEGSITVQGRQAFVPQLFQVGFAPGEALPAELHDH